jgi:HlyD family secretion protein/epimerase transport system membrane fusion protein
VLAIERTLEQLLGSVGADEAEIARAQSGAGEAKSQIISLKQRFHEELVSNRREVQAEIMDLQERLIVAEDILERIEIRAPQSGIIQNLEVHTVGGIVRPGEPLMEIVPQGEELLIAVRVAPTDIDNIELGQSTEVRFTALNARTTPILFGEVMSVSGDIINESPSELPYFLVRVRLPEDEREKNW